MVKFSDFLREIQHREGLDPIPMIRAWFRDELETIEEVIREAAVNRNLIGSQIPNLVGTNQAKGNRVADHCFKELSSGFSEPNQLLKARGPGYPDLILKCGSVGYCMEMKATSIWSDVDTNRRVLTSSAKKLQDLISEEQISSPTGHIVCTVIYDGPSSTVDQIRLDFIDSFSEVNVRLEASTSQRLLARGNHEPVIIS